MVTYFLYEIGACGQYKDEDDELQIRNFDFVQELLENRIEEICKAVGATEPPTIFFTGKGNFRFEVAKTKPYKGNRKDVEKPFHHKNILVYLEAAYDCRTAEDCEADDELAMAQIVDLEESIPYDSSIYNKEESRTVICTRDKDLRMIPGWHYGWECGLQPEFELQWVSEMGELTARWKPTEDPLALGTFKDLKGTGIKWFYAQLLMGDSTDNIPGCPGIGPKKAWEILEGCETEYELYIAVLRTYFDKVGKGHSERMLEQAQLLWMVRERNEDNQLIMWEPPNEIS